MWNQVLFLLLTGGGDIKRFLSTAELADASLEGFLVRLKQIVCLLRLLTFD